MEVREAFNICQRVLADVIEKTELGELNPLNTWAQINLIEKEIKSVKSQIEGAAREEAELYPEKSFKFEGFTFEKRSGGYSYSYKEIPRWASLKDEMTKIEQQSKAAFNLFQKTGTRPITEDGELLPLPDVTPRKDSLVVKSVK